MKFKAIMSSSYLKGSRLNRLLEMKNIRADVQFVVKEDIKTTEIQPRIVNIHLSLFSFVFRSKEMAARIKRCHESVQVDPREKRPKSRTTPEIIENFTI